MSFDHNLTRDPDFYKMSLEKKSIHNLSNIQLKSLQEKSIKDIKLYQNMKFEKI